MRRCVAGRVQRLEVHFRPRRIEARPPSAEDLLFRAKLRELLLKMDAKYTGVVLEDFKHPLSEASNLTLAVCKRARDHIRQNTPLAFPKEVAEVYLSRKVRSDTRCWGCGYSVPAASFTACPLCGGRLGWPAYAEAQEVLATSADDELKVAGSAGAQTGYPFGPAQASDCVGALQNRPDQSPRGLTTPIDWARF
jgi:hypothetical protein